MHLRPLGHLSTPPEALAYHVTASAATWTGGIGASRAAPYHRGVRAAAWIIASCWVALAQAGVGGPGPPFPNFGPPLILRLEGVLERSREGARTHGFDVASLGFLGGEDDRRWLGVTEARTIGGDQSVDGKDVLAAVAPFTPNLLITGPRELTDGLRSFPPGTRVVLEGLVDRGARTYYLRRSERAPDA